MKPDVHARKSRKLRDRANSARVLHSRACLRMEKGSARQRKAAAPIQPVRQETSACRKISSTSLKAGVHRISEIQPFTIEIQGFLARTTFGDKRWGDETCVPCIKP